MMKKSDNLNVISMIIKSEFLEYDLLYQDKIPKNKDLCYLEFQLWIRQVDVKLKEKGKKVAEAKVAWEALTGPRNMKVVNQLAKQYSVLGGKWMCHLASGKIDRVWSKVASTLLAGGLGTPVYMVKVSPLEDVTPQQAGAGGGVS